MTEQTLTDIVELNKRREESRQVKTDLRYATRDKLYYNFRYRKDSYKARKAMIHPFLMTAKRGDSMLRLYDDGSHQPTKHQETAMTAKCKGWRQKERELKQLAKLEATKNKHLNKRIRSKRTGYTMKNVAS